MTTVNQKYEYELTLGTVYRIIPTAISNITPVIHIKGIGSVDLKSSTLLPADANDLTLNTEDTELLGFYTLNALPNFIKIEDNVAGAKTIVLKGIQEPEIVTF